jgi:hypothetical protein
MIINRLHENRKSSVAVVCFFPSRAKDLSAPLYFSLSLNNFDLHKSVFCNLLLSAKCTTTRLIRIYFSGLVCLAVLSRMHITWHDKIISILHCSTNFGWLNVTVNWIYYLYTIIIPIKCTRCLLLKAQDITICTFDVELHLIVRWVAWNCKAV